MAAVVATFAPAHRSRNGVLLGRQYSVGRAAQEGSCAAGPLLTLNITQETSHTCERVVATMVLRELLLLFCALATVFAQDVITTITVCEAVQDLSNKEGKPIAVAGRYSMRGGTHWISQECGGAKSIKLRLVLDTQKAPHLPQSAMMDEHAAQEELRQVRLSTSLEKFRFGSADYDRWAVVYGSLHRSGEEQYFSYRGDGVVFFYPDH